MKLAVVGKGGVGKTTLTSLLCYYFAQQGRQVFAIDADPDANLATSLGVPDPETITPIVEMRDLIAERTGTSTKGGYGVYFKLNPQVADIPDQYATEINGIKLVVLGAVREGGGGCACPENVFLRAMMQHLLVARDEVVIMDMEAGIEHLGRGTAGAVDRLVVVVRPSRLSIDTAHRIKRLAAQIGLTQISAVGNMLHSDEEREILKSSLQDIEFLGFLPHTEAIAQLDLKGFSNSKMPRLANELVGEVARQLESLCS